jgi:hypothetical protein
MDVVVTVGIALLVKSRQIQVLVSIFWPLTWLLIQADAHTVVTLIVISVALITESTSRKLR